MSPDWPSAALELLARLVRTPSPSGEEAAAAALLAGWAREHGLAVEHDDAAVRLTVTGRQTGPTLLLASHLDTVPPGEGWTTDPYGALEREGRLYGRGAADAKASLAAMATAAARLASDGWLPGGRLIVLATYAEETRATTMPEALRRLGAPPDAAVIGEPTSLAPCVAQRGLLLLQVRWRGEQLHAGWATEVEPRPANAIMRAATDLVKLQALRLPRRHPLLGEVAFTPTSISAGIARNVTPPSCEVLLDIRTTPEYRHDQVVAFVRGGIKAEVEVLSDRLEPVATPPGSRLLRVVQGLRPNIAPIGSPTASDWVWLREVDAVKMGPGSSRLSHTADEWVAPAEVADAVELYTAVAREYLR